MKKRVLIVHPNSDLAWTIRDLLEEVGRAEHHDLSVNWARTQAKAEQLASAAEPVDLVVTGVEVPEDDTPSAGAGEQRRLGVELVRRLRALRPETSAILIASHVDDDVFAFSQSEGVRLVMEGGRFGERLKSEVSGCLVPQKSETRERVDLEISLSAKKGCCYQFQREGRKPGEVHFLTVDPSKWRDWVEDSHDWVRQCRAGLEQSRGTPIMNHGWERPLKRLSEGLAHELLESTPANREFLKELSWWIGRVGIENIRVRFAVDDAIYPIPVEAFKQTADDDYWMLRTAVYRRQEERADRITLEPRVLFQDEQTRNQPVNFLIIQADVSREVSVQTSQLNLTLDALPTLEKEVSKVRTLLSDLKKAACPAIGEVRVINREAVPAGGSFRKLVEEVLKERPWHVLHYAGHTYYDPQNQVGYLFFPVGDYELEDIRIDRFAWSLSKADTRFVFLSSCEGGQQDFIYHLSKVGIPAIMGFLLDVRDEEAGAYAVSFYRHLLEQKEKSLEYACLEARKEMHGTFPDSPIWASPVLVIRLGV
jgi:CheY-like chemotaxis protein